ncbi:hypothetical protein Hanom_Chr08g00730621 [Helianthus anomalus]
MKLLVMMKIFQLKLRIDWNPGRRQKLVHRRGKRKGLRSKLLILPVSDPLLFLSLITLSFLIHCLLGAGEKPRGSDPEDRSTLTEMMRKKALEDKKRKLDEQAAAMLAVKKARLQKEAPLAPSESEIDMGVFSGDRGNLLEEIFAASAPTAQVRYFKNLSSCSSSIEDN